MLLSAILTRDELSLVLESLTPLRVTIDAQRDRAVTFDRPALELVQGRGLRVRGEARVVWDVAGIVFPVTIQSWQLLLEPRVGIGGRPHVLTCHPTLEVLDLKLCPGLVEDRLAGAVENGISKAKGRLAWDFGRTLSRYLSLPTRVRPAKGLDLVVTGGACAVTETELSLRVELSARVDGTVKATARSARSEA
jgi:hypothetical protein